jgi:mono/diheme cytochrome c family protein
MLAVAGKSGRVYGVDRATQTLAFDTPTTTLENDQEPLDANWKYVCPGLQGGSQFNGTAYHPETGTLYVGMGDHCAWFIKDTRYGSGGGVVVKDWAAAAKLKAPTGWITALDGETGQVLWRYHTESQVQAGLVPTKSGLLFAGDTHGNLLAFDAKTGAVLKRIDVKGALNNGLISYSVGDEQYLAAAVGGPTENPSTVAGPLRVSIFGLRGSDTPKVVKLERLAPAPGVQGNVELFAQVCGACHGLTGTGGSAPPITRQSQLADPKLLKEFLATVPQPMPRLYPGLLKDKEVEMIAEYLKTDVFKCGLNGQRCLPPAKPTSGGTKEWRKIYSVLTSPRCLNCHTWANPIPTKQENALSKPAGYFSDFPRQGDDRHPHYFNVIRGDDEPLLHGAGIGAPFERCASCHGSTNDPKTGIPGACLALDYQPPPVVDPEVPRCPSAFWGLTPRSMTWETAVGVPMTGAQLCASIKDPTKTQRADLKDVQDHLANEPAVNWAWNPGTRPNGEARTTPPISQRELVDAFDKWRKAGAPCPGDDH